MWPVFPAAQTLTVSALAFALILFATRILQPEWWRTRFVRTAILVAFGTIPLGIAIWHIGEGLQHAGIIRFGTGIAYVAVLTILPAALVTPIAAALDRGLAFAFVGRAAARTSAPTGSQEVDDESETRTSAPTRAKVQPSAIAKDPRVPEHASATSALGGAEVHRAPNDPSSARLGAEVRRAPEDPSFGPVGAEVPPHEMTSARIGAEVPPQEMTSARSGAEVPRRARIPAGVGGSRVSRRGLFRFGSASLPAIAAAGGASGFFGAKGDPTIPVLRFRYPGLHADLRGLKILQLSDLHLGACLGLEDLRRGLEIAKASHRPDLIVLTGDVADDPNLIPDALRMVHEVGARHGAIASLGNHEYIHDIDVTRPLFEASPIPLLVGSGRTVSVGDAKLFVAGADDPVAMHGDIASFVRPTIEAAAADAPDDADFSLLLCHRPEGFGPAAEQNFDLTLSGHTHGGQLGFLGRSLLERVKPGIGWWGAYAKQRKDGRGPSRLYTTSGFGHWFPFRLGCPTEMPLIVLEGEPTDVGMPTRA